MFDYLLKFISKKEYAEEFLNGILYFNTADYFARCDNAGQQDILEGSTFFLNPVEHEYKSANVKIIEGKPCIVVEDFSEHPEKYEKSTVLHFSKSENRKLKIISFFETSFDVNTKRFSISKDMSTQFGNYCIMILDVNEFIKRTVESVNKNPDIKNFKCAPIQYKKMTGFVEMTPFIKEYDKYHYQNEYRMIFYTDDEKPYKLKLDKDINDIAMAIDLSRLDELLFENNEIQLYYDQRIYGSN